MPARLLIRLFCAGNPGVRTAMVLGYRLKGSDRGKPRGITASRSARLAAVGGR